MGSIEEALELYSPLCGNLRAAILHINMQVGGLIAQSNNSYIYFLAILVLHECELQSCDSLEVGKRGIGNAVHRCCPLSSDLDSMEYP